MATKKKAEYAPPASQVDLEERLENGNKSNAVLSTAEVREGEDVPEDGRDFRVEDNDIEGYVGVNPEYQTYANETEAPGVADEGPEAEVFESFSENLITEPVPASPPEDEEEEEPSEPEASSGSDSSSSS